MNFNNENEAKGIAIFVMESTKHIKYLHEEVRNLTQAIHHYNSAIAALLERVKHLEKENECLKKEFEQISLVN